MFKVYIAAPYSMKETVAAEAAELQAVGIECTSSWVKERHAATVQMGDLTHDEHLTYALQDVEDVLAADLLMFHIDPTKTIVRGGRHVEFGMAVMINRISRKMPIFVIGEDRENIFHHLQYVIHFATWELALAAADKIANRDKVFVFKHQGF